MGQVESHSCNNGPQSNELVLPHSSLSLTYQWSNINRKCSKPPVWAIEWLESSWAWVPLYILVADLQSYASHQESLLQVDRSYSLPTSNWSTNLPKINEEAMKFTFSIVHIAISQTSTALAPPWKLPTAIFSPSRIFRKCFVFSVTMDTKGTMITHFLCFSVVCLTTRISATKQLDEYIWRGPTHSFACWRGSFQVRISLQL